MGGVRLFGRRWSVSTDDWVFSSIIELLLRLIWLIILLVVTFSHLTRERDCISIHIYRIFCYGLVTCLVINLPLTIGLMVSSARGSILRGRHKRIPWVPIFIYLKLVVYITEIGWVIFGLYWAFYDQSKCDWSLVLIIRIMVVLALIVAIFNAVNVWVIFDPLGSETNQGRRDERIMKTHKMWERRCRILCCGCAPKDREKDAFTSIAHILTDYFVDMDLTPSDIAAGLLLLRHRQEYDHTLLDTGTQMITIPTILPSGADDPEWLELKTIAYFMKYALSCYGWPVYMMMNLCSGCCRLCGLYRCCCCGCCQDPNNEEIQAIDDNCCQCHFAAVLKVTGLSRSHILHITFHNDLFESPYFVAVDHNEKKLIIAVRGSLSASDGLTDLSAIVGSLEPEGYPTFVVHGGILQSSRYICQRLLQTGILDRAFNSYPEYRLVLCGHSLGAGIASVLAVLLKRRFPGVKAYAYSPPLGLMNKEMADFCIDFVVSISLGYDLVTRLSIRNMYSLKQRVLEELHNTDQPKYKIVAKGVFRFCCGNMLQGRVRSPTGDEPLIISSSRSYQSTMDTESGVIGDSDLEPDQLLNINNNSNNNAIVIIQPVMLFGGRMLHIVEVNDKLYQLPQDDELDVQFSQPNDVASCLGVGRRNYRAVWSNSEHFNEILIHPRMITDHLPDRVDAALRYLVTNQVKPFRANNVQI